MQTAGIIIEYNPMHDGQLYLLEQVRAQLGADTAFVGVMSGNFVQRGDFALLRKHARARAAVESGSARRCGSTASRPHGTTRASPRRSGGKTRRTSSTTAAR